MLTYGRDPFHSTWPSFSNVAETKVKSFVTGMQYITCMTLLPRVQRDVRSYQQGGMKQGGIALGGRLGQDARPQCRMQRKIGKGMTSCSIEIQVKGNLGFHLTSITEA